MTETDNRENSIARYKPRQREEFAVSGVQAAQAQCAESELASWLGLGWKDSGWRWGTEKPYLAVLYTGSRPETQTGSYWHWVTPVEARPDEGRGV